MNQNDRRETAVAQKATRYTLRFTGLFSLIVVGTTVGWALFDGISLQRPIEQLYTGVLVVAPGAWLPAAALTVFWLKMEESNV